MTFLNNVLNPAFELLIGALSHLSVPASLAFVSFVTAIAVLFIMHMMSNQQAIAVAERQMYADLLEMRLFKDDLWLMGRAMWAMCRHNVAYLRLAFVPALFSFVLIALTMGQLDSYFGYSGVPNGEPVLVTTVLKSDVRANDVALSTPARVRVESPAILFPALRQVAWRVIADSPGSYVLGVHVDGTVYEKTLDVSDRLVRRSPLRSGERLTDQVLNPSEPPLPGSAPITSIRVAYPTRQIDIFGAQMDWVGPYMALSIFFALVLKRASSQILRVGRSVRL